MTEVVAALIWDKEKFMICQRPVHKARGLLWEFAALKNNCVKVDSYEVQMLVKRLQTYITANYYTCTDEILAGLGEMYVADERFAASLS